MPKLKNYKPGKRINIWMPERSLKILDQIENKSNFFQMALEQAAGIMAFDIIATEKGLTPAEPTDEQLRDFNTKYPLDPLTAKRIDTNQWPKNSRKLPDVLS